MVPSCLAVACTFSNPTESKLGIRGKFCQLLFGYTWLAAVWLVVFSFSFLLLFLLFLSGILYMALNLDDFRLLVLPFPPYKYWSHRVMLLSLACVVLGREPSTYVCQSGAYLCYCINCVTLQGAVPRALGYGSIAFWC